MRRCRFPHDAAAAARVALDAGCYAYPDDREQDLCFQHLARCTPGCCVSLLEAYADERDVRIALHLAPA